MQESCHEGRRATAATRRDRAETRWHGACTLGTEMTRSKDRNRPLWQFFLAILLVFFAIQRGQLVAMLFLSDASPVLVGAHALQAGLALATALGIWLGWGGVVALVIVLGLAVAATVLLEAFHLAVRPPLPAISQLLVVLIVTAALSLLLRHEFTGQGRSSRSS